MNIASLQFTCRKNIGLCPEKSVGDQIKTAEPVSKGGTVPPKMSAIAVVLSKILLDKNVSALVSKNGGCYAEVSQPGEKTKALFYDGDRNINSNEVEPYKDDFLFLIPVFLSHYFTGRDVETIMTADEAVESYASAGSVTPEKLARACSAFYFGTKDKFLGKGNDINEGFFTASLRSQIDQAARTGELMAPKDLAKETGEGAILAAKLLDTFTEIGMTVKPQATQSGDAKAETQGWFTALRHGAKAIGFEWSKEAQKLIRPPSFLDGFVPNTALKIMSEYTHSSLEAVIGRLTGGEDGTEGIIGEDYVNVILPGKPGTGKTATAEALSAALEMPIYTVPLSKYTEEDTFTGMNKISEGQIKFAETPFLTAYENGGIVVLEEFNLADPAVVMGAIGQAIVPPFVLHKDGYIPVHRHPLCVVIMTMNTGTQGSRPPNEAFTSRSPIVIQMDDPADAEFTAILESKGHRPKDCRTVFGAYRKLQEFLTMSNDTELAYSITLRHCLGALRLIAGGVPFKTAVKNTMIGAVAIKDTEAAQKLYEDIIEPMKDR